MVLKMQASKGICREEAHELFPLLLLSLLFLFHHLCPSLHTLFFIRPLTGNMKYHFVSSVAVVAGIVSSVSAHATVTWGDINGEKQPYGEKVSSPGSSPSMAYP